MNRLTTTLRERQAEAARLDVAIAASLGDRVMLTRLERRGGRSVVEYVTSGPNEPRCCPTQQVEAVCALRKKPEEALSMRLSRPLASRGIMLRSLRRCALWRRRARLRACHYRKMHKGFINIVFEDRCLVLLLW